jgi:hypothetical protein
VLIDPGQSSAWYFDRLAAAGATVVRGMDPCTLPRSTKNEVEIEGTRQAHIRDGAALTRFLHWVDTVAQETLPDERQVAEALEGFREATGALKDLSFDTIAGAGPNGALPHYKPVAHPAPDGEGFAAAGRRRRPVSGRHHRCDADHGRGRARRADQRRMFTLVLKGHIAMAVVRFPAGTTGHQLDAAGPPAHVDGGPRLRPRHRPRRRQLSGRPRRPAAHRQGGQQPAAADRHDPVQRARLLPRRPLGHPHRDPAGGHAADPSPAASGRCTASNS